IAAAVVVSLQTVGAILVVALLITPAATAYLFTDRLTSLMAWAVFFGLGASWIGLYLSYYFALPTGAIIVVVATAQFALVFLALRLRPILGVVFKGLAGRVSLGLRK
ncbi:MAG: metal ABC transporter permease, partial [Limnochordia bacterium]